MIKKLQVKFKKLNPNAKIPNYAKDGDAGLDLTSISSVTEMKSGEYSYTEYGTGLAVEIPKGYVGLLFPRSSISNTGLILSNSVGVVDSGYRGEIKARFKYIPGSTYYKVGDRVCQLLILSYPQIDIKEVDELTISERGDKGYGSTGT